MNQPEPTLRDQLAAIVVRDRREGVSAESTADAVIDIINEMGATRCRDKDCIRRRPHPQLAPHRWRHIPTPPLTRVLFGWTCFTCGRRKSHRIHNARKADHA